MTTTADYLYYQVGEYKTTNKLSAVEKANGDISKIHLYFADDVHAQYNWTIEPKESLNDLIDDRVRRLREKYTTICLWYSGGYDSQTILDSFIRTKTRIDEIIIYDKSPYTRHVFDNEAQVALKIANYVKENHQPWINIRLIAYTPETPYKIYKKYGSDWIWHDRGHFIQFTKNSRGNTLGFQSEFINLQRLNRRVDITGVDKPRVNLVNGKWYAFMPDSAIFPHFDSPQDLFYMCPDATKIYIKQVWQVIRWFESNPNVDHNFVHRVQGSERSQDVNIIDENEIKMYASWNKGLGRSDAVDWVASSGVTKKFVTTRKLGKELSSISSFESNAVRDYFEKEHPQLFNSWIKGLQYIESKYSNIWDPSKNGFATVCSNFIYIKDFEPNFTKINCGS